MAAALLSFLTLTPALAAGNPTPGPWGIHSPSEYAAGADQWDTVSDWIEQLKLRYANINSSNSLPHPPHVSLHNVNMTDGVKLSTILINPYPYDKPKGTAIARSPYGPTSENLADLFVLSNGFAAVLQDDRGTFSSGGKFDIWRGGSADGVTTMEWVTSQNWSNGEVYTMGISADGINEGCEIIAAPPMLKGQWLMWTTTNGHHFSYPGGAYRQDLTDGYMNFMNIEIHNAADRVIKEVREHEAFSDYWKPITVCRDPVSGLDEPDCHWKKVTWPILLSGGWWDIFLQTSSDMWNGMRKGSDPSVRDKHVNIVSPLGHCILSPVDPHPILAAAEADAFAVGAKVAAEFFRGQFDGPTRSKLGRVNFYVMGGYDGPSRGSWNYWTSLDEWPKPKPVAYYLGTNNAIGSAPPSQLCTAEYDYDPQNPSPMLGGNNLPIFTKMGHCGHVDQTKREARDDVITFDSAPLSEDLAVVGTIRAKLFASSSANDTDFMVTVSDLSGKKSQLIRYGLLRMRWRERDDTQSAHLVPGKIYEADVELASTAYVFPKGHRIRISVSSAAYPYFHPNSNTGEFDLVKKVTPIVAHNVIYMSPQYPSQITLPIVELKDIPENPEFPGLADRSHTQVVV